MSAVSLTTSRDCFIDIWKRTMRSWKSRSHALIPAPALEPGIAKGRCTETSGSLHLLLSPLSTPGLATGRRFLTSLTTSLTFPAFPLSTFLLFRVAYGIRTHDLQGHNLAF